MSAPKVCMLSCLHDLYDDRIYWKEALSLKKHGYDVSHIAVGNEEKDFISEHGIRLISVRRKTYFKNPYLDKLFRTVTFRKSVYKEILKKADSLKANVYHFHDLQLNRIGPKLKKLKHNPKVVYDVHEPYSITYASFGRTTFEKNIFKIYAKKIELWELKSASNYDLIIATEENVVQHFQKKLPQISSTIIYNYSDLNKIKRIDKTIDFIYVGGIRRRRGAINIITAAELLKKQIQNFKILFIGTIHDKGLYEEMITLVSQKGLKDNIIIEECVPYKKITEFYSTAKIGLAIFNNEKVNQTIMPIKLFEYINMGLPSICSNIGHLKKTTLEYKSGLLVKPDDDIELSKAMFKLLQDKKLYEDLTSNCKNASKNVNWKVMEVKLLKQYTNLLQNDKEEKLHP